MRKIIVVLILLAVAGGGAFFFFWSKETAPKYKTVKVTKGDMEAVVTATGTVNAVTTVLIGTQVSGAVKNIYVDFNSPVQKGQVIARIDPGIFQALLDQAAANLLAAKSNLVKAKASLEDAKRTLERNKELFKRDLIAKSELDTSGTNYETAKAQITASEAQIAQTTAALNLAETNLRYTQITSPVDGIVDSRKVDVGQTVAASFHTPTLFTIAQDLTKMQIDSNVAEADIGKVVVGMPVEFTVDAYSEITFKGVVSEIRNAPIIVQNVVTYDVVAKVDNTELKLKPGMTANISIIHSKRKNILKVPNSALRFSPANYKRDGTQGRIEGAGVWIEENGVLKRVKVTTGISDGIFTEVITGEVKEGQGLIAESIEKPKGYNHGGPRMF
ncbi:MAG: efflux RND transporter periplasmic adaptor subunit [Deltaproteobacteria bacterium]|nr:efflux RND transporter periplasmic adaptor subunit [Deltaproteobacteria bacterium]